MESASRVLPLRLAVVALAALGCAGDPVPLYDGPQRPTTEVAQVVAVSPTRASIFGIDDTRRRGTAFELEPGVHRVWAHVREEHLENGWDYSIWMYCAIQAELAPGHRYELRSVNEVVKGKADTTELRVAAKLVDPATGAELHASYCGREAIGLRDEE